MQKSGRRVFVSSMLAVLTAGLAALAAAPAGSARQPDRPDWAGKVDKLFAAFDRPDSPGCALGMFKDGRVIYEHGYGSADLEHDVPITPETVFYAGSVSKQFTAMAAALAIKEGLFGLDDDVRKFVPELPSYGKPILVRHLIHHTSGLRDVNTLVAAAGSRDEAAFDNDAVLRVLSRQRALNFTPGSDYLYSNSGYAVLALVVERTSGTPFAEYADSHIFKPLGMAVSHFHTDIGRLVPRRAYAYERTATGLRLDTPQNERAGAGGLFTTVRELLRWDENFYSGRVGGPALIAQLETPDRLDSGAANSYAWGLQTGRYRGLPVVEHSGALGGYRAQILRLRAQHFSVAILCNVSTANPTELSYRVADVYLSGRFPEPVPAVVPAMASRADAPRPSQGPAYSREELSGFAGMYRGEELDTTYALTVRDGRLTLRRGVAKESIPLFPTGRDEFRAAAASLRFERAASGRVTGFVLDAGRMRGIVFTRANPGR